MTRATVLLWTLAAGLSACSSQDRVRLEPIRGQVLFNGRPLDRALVAFNPVGEYPPELPKPIAYTDAEGRFKMTTNQASDGVRAGDYVVTVEWREKSRSGVEKIGGKNLLPVRYSKAESSPLRCAVTAGQNELPAFQLTD
jgi:hypothetical protein